MKKPDWEAIEADYRAGILSVREIAVKHGISHTAINKKARKESWDRDLNAKVRAKADLLVSKKEVSKQVSNEIKLTERILVEANAEVIANVRMEHRNDIRKARELFNSLLSELEIESDNRELLKELGETMRAGDKDKLNDIYMDIVSLPSRIESFKKLMDAAKSVITLERQAYSMDDKNASIETTELPQSITIKIEDARLKHDNADP